jgi:thymidine phosphorylase
MVVLAGVTDSIDDARMRAAAALDDGRALEKMREIVIAQGGDPAVLDDPALLPQADTIAVLEADRAGVIASMDTRAIGRAAVALGAGRASIEDRVDPRVGFHITAKPGTRVEAGEPLATVHAADESAAARGVEALRAAIVIADAATAPLPLVSHRVSIDGIVEVA